MDISITQTAPRGTLGDWDHKTNTIRVKRRMKPQIKASTLLHESLHAMFEISGLSDKMKAELEEEIIRQIESHLYQFIKDNPEVVRYIQET